MDYDVHSNWGQWARSAGSWDSITPWGFRLGEFGKLLLMAAEGMGRNWKPENDGFPKRIFLFKGFRFHMKLRCM